MSNEDKFYLNKERVPHDQKEENLIQLTRREVAQFIQDHAESIHERAIPFSPEMDDFKSDQKVCYEQGFRRLGIEEIHWGEYFFKVPDIDGHATYGNSLLGIIRIGDLSTEVLNPVHLEEAVAQKRFLPLEVPAGVVEGNPEEAARHLRNYIEALYIAHELYHDAAPTSIFVQTVTDESTGHVYHAGDSYSPDRSGVHYVKASKKGDSPAVEEGLAMTLQKESRKLAAQHFPEGAKIYTALLDYVIATDPRVGPTGRSLMVITNFDGNTVKYGIMQYMNGYLLTNYLSRQIPDFFKLVEHARIRGDTMPLARAIEKRFGKGSYRKIFTTGDSEALKVLEELEAGIGS